MLRCRLTYRWESSLWLSGRQVYLGGFGSEEEAARAYDLAALGCKGLGAEINFPATDYAKELATDLAKLSQVSSLQGSVDLLRACPYMLYERCSRSLLHLPRLAG